MGSICNAYTARKWLDHVFNTASFTPPTNLYVGLSTTTIADSNTSPNITEPSGSYAYARQLVAFDAAASRATTNSSPAVSFPKNTGTNWGTITDWFICDHASATNWGTGVNLIAFGTLSSPKQVVVDNTPSIAAGEIDISVNESSSSGGMCTYLVNEMLDHTFRNSAYSIPTIYLGLCTDSNTVTQRDAGTYTEVAVSPDYAYARKAYSSGWDVATGGVTANTAAITWTSPTGSWGEIHTSIIADGGTRAAGNILFWATVTSQTPGTGDTVQYDAGAFDITLT